MKRNLDLQKAGAAEAFGVLAVRRSAKRAAARKARARGFSANQRALGEVACFLWQFAKAVGAKRQPVKCGNVSLEVQRQGADEILSVRKLAAA